MAILDPIPFSGSTDGKNIKVAADGSTGTTIHTADANAIDQIYLWATNTSTSRKRITIEFGGTGNPDDYIEFDVPSQDGAYLLIPGWTLTNSLVVTAFAELVNVIVINGYVYRR